MPFRKTSLSIFILLILFVFSAYTNGCRAQENQISSSKDIDKLSKKLGIEISENSSNISLYKEVSKWLGTRYRRGGMSFSGVDCSGFTGSIYSAVFDKKLHRRSTDIANNVVQNIKKEELQTGDLVFFATSRRKGINHVGIYLKDNYFIHASCGKGVIVSSLNEPYYQRTWKKGGRMDVEEFNIRYLPDWELTVQIPLLETDLRINDKIIN